MDEFKPVAKDIAPYLSAVNLNGMKHDGSKILTIGKGDYEKAMVRELVSNGFNGPWGIMGHVEGADVKTVLEENLTGLNRLE